MAPEVIAGKPVGPAADLYALGAILHERLVGTQAFERDSIEAIFAAHLFDAPPTLPPEVPRGLAELVRRLLAKEPSERLGGADQVRAALAVTLEATDPLRVRTGESAARGAEVVGLGVGGGRGGGSGRTGLGAHTFGG